MRARDEAGLQVLELVFANVGSWGNLLEVLSLTAGKALAGLTTVNTAADAAQMGVSNAWASSDGGSSGKLLEVLSFTAREAVVRLQAVNSQGDLAEVMLGDVG